MAPLATFFDVIVGTGVNAQVPGARFEGDAEIALDSSYPTGGYTIAQLTAGLPLSVVTHFRPYALGPSLSATCNDFAYDRANGKVKLVAGNSEVSNATDVSAFKLFAVVGGRR